jgi:16S rRNA (adenine1518-N6/adenine1519-N6)-dimethyltransferase
VVSADEEEPYRLLVQGAFGLRRKQLRRVVRTLWSLDAEAADAVLARAGLDGELRPEVLTPEHFAALLRARVAT